MIRVAYFIDTFNIGGAETVTLRLAQQLLSEPGYQPVIIHFNSEAIASQCKRLNIPCLSAPARRYYKKTITLPLFAWVFRGFLKKHQIDVLHSHLYGPIIASAPAAWLCGIPHIGTLHDTYTIAERPNRIHLLRLAAWFKTQLVTVSKQMEAYYHQQAHFSSTAITTIVNGVHVAAAENTSANKGRLITRKSLNISANEIVVICVARLVPLKRHQLLIKAIKQLNNSSLRLLIVGDGPERQSLETLAHTLQLTNSIIFTGERNDVSDLLAAADIFALTSSTEGLSCSILEAMAAGLPIVATDVGGNSELVAQGENGYLINSHRPEEDIVRSLTNHLNELLQSLPLRQRLGTHSRQIVQEKYNWTHTFHQYKAHYSKKENP